MTWFITAGVAIGATVGAASGGITGGGKGAARGAGMGALGGAFTGGMGGLASGAFGGAAGGTGGGLFGGLMGGGAAAPVQLAGPGVAAGTAVPAAAGSGGAASGGFLGTMGQLATPSNMNTLTGMLGGGGQQKGPQALPPVAPVSSQSMGGMAQMAPPPAGIVSTQQSNPLGSNEIAQLMMMKRLGLV